MDVSERASLLHPADLSVLAGAVERVFQALLREAKAAAEYAVMTEQARLQESSYQEWANEHLHRRIGELEAERDLGNAHLEVVKKTRERGASLRRRHLMSPSGGQMAQHRED